MNTYSSGEYALLVEKVQKIQEELDRIVCDKHLDAYFLVEGIREGCKAALKGNYGVGSVIVHDGKIVARGQNRVMERGYQYAPAAHGETESIFNLRAGEHKHLSRRDLILYAPLEPCMLCTAVIMNEGIGSVIIGSLDLPGGMMISHYEKMPPVFREIIRDSGMRIEKADVHKRIEELAWEVFFMTKHAIDSLLKYRGTVVNV